MINSPAGLRQFFSSVDCIFIYCLRLLPKRVLNIINIRKLPKWVIQDPLKNDLLLSQSFQYILTMLSQIKQPKSVCVFYQCP